VRGDGLSVLLDGSRMVVSLMGAIIKVFAAIASPRPDQARASRSRT
jgi:hypothetical protein